LTRIEVINSCNRSGCKQELSNTNYEKMVSHSSLSIRFHFVHINLKAKSSNFPRRALQRLFSHSITDSRLLTSNLLEINQGCCMVDYTESTSNLEKCDCNAR